MCAQVYVRSATKVCLGTRLYEATTIQPSPVAQKVAKEVFKSLDVQLKLLVLPQMSRHFYRYGREIQY